ncbi:hypothetical protein WJX74_007703 [Apatococcus lobatus]|uniref:Uncharacterized protein n=1 Tax=Apatococcus lobatus TaxID=904363 RepID=A0AAW1RMG9_9CHLO
MAFAPPMAANTQREPMFVLARLWEILGVIAILMLMALLAILRWLKDVGQVAKVMLTALLPIQDKQLIAIM